MIWRFLRPTRLVGLMVVLALVGGGFWLWQSARSSNAAREADALTDFRARGGVAGIREQGVPRPGVYTYDAAGDESGAIGPASLSRELPDRALYLITLTPGGYQEELRFSEEHIETVRLQVRDENARAVWRRTEFSVLGVGEDDRRDLTPPPLDVPSSLSVGKVWNNDYSAGALRIRSAHRVISRGAVRVGVRQEPVFVVRVAGEISGAYDGTRVDLLWWSPRLSLPVRWEIHMNVGGVAKIRTDVELRLRSTTPQT